MFAKLVIGCLAVMLVSATDEKSPEYKAAYQKGREEADRALQNGRPVLFTYGLLRADAAWIDRESGVPIEAIAGCIVDDSICGRADGNNERIHEFVKKSGPPAGSFKKWEKELFDLAGYAKNHEKDARKVAIDGEALEAPRGEVVVRVRGDDIRLPDGKTIRSVEMWITPKDGAAVMVPAALMANQPIELFWGPENSGFFVVRQGKGPQASYQAIDARNGRTLRWEHSASVTARDF